jgi:hypothetical protein
MVVDVYMRVDWTMSTLKSEFPPDLTEPHWGYLLASALRVTETCESIDEMVL